MKAYENITNQDIQAIVGRNNHLFVKSVRRFRSTRQFCVSCINSRGEKVTLWVNYYDDGICIGLTKHTNMSMMYNTEVDQYLHDFGQMVEAVMESDDLTDDEAMELLAYGDITILPDFYCWTDKNKSVVYIINRTRLTVNKIEQ